MSASSTGWLKLHRSLLDHPRFTDGDWLKVWLYLLASATHAERRVVFGTKDTALKPGQLITSRLSIATKCKVEESKVERLLSLMKTEQQIEQVSSSRSRLITVLNWERYQDREQQTDQQLNGNRTTGEQQVNTNKKGKNVETVENGKKETPKKDFEYEIPVLLSTPAFREAVKEWLEHLKDIKKRISKRSLELQLKKCDGIGEQRALKMIENSICNGWGSLHEEKSKDSSNASNNGVAGKGSTPYTPPPATLGRHL